uniref:N-alpha-acetyltransferase 60 n=1 Tax=Nicotiana tabacum TaxID=4097 RepID=A0A1S3ZU28_TOBAC|nr:PREDICTED: histone acetyltransferase MCC1-like [Nicotiana tabacum]
MCFFANLLTLASFLFSVVHIWRAERREEITSSLQRLNGHSGSWCIDGGKPSQTSFTDTPNFCRGLMLDCAMQNLKLSHNPLIHYRPIRTSDLEVLQKIHGDLFPIRYESEFFQNVVNGRGIVSWGAVDRNRPNGQNDELIGFVTARTVLAKDSDIEDFLRYDSSRSEQTLIYILTLGVADSYRNLGIASSLIHEVIKYASNIPTCRAVYLHVISYNNPAIYLYKKMYFQCVKRLPAFYFINGQHYDAYLFIYYVNGGRSPCSPL